jgi:hypothetical protein
MHATRVIFFLKYYFRLPIVQGSTFSYLIPTISILTLPQYQCPEQMKSGMFNNLFLHASVIYPGFGIYSSVSVCSTSRKKAKYLSVFNCHVQFRTLFYTVVIIFYTQFADPTNSTFDGIWKIRIREV